MTSPFGQTKFSHQEYKLIDELGRGGMGVVYRCHDLKRGKDVAVKVIGWNLSDDEVVRFHREARALAKLQHPNILSIYNFDQADDGSLFLVMELLEGRSLGSIISDNQSFSLDDSLEIFTQICDGLTHAHRKGVLHRDIKPTNIFLHSTTNGAIVVTITDFGLAKLLTEDQRLTKTGIGLGSPPYMSPEQADGQMVDERSDIYSFGCLMLEMLTGQTPFQSSSIPGMLFKHLNEPAPMLNDLVPEKGYPVQLEDIVAKCLEKKAENRYTDFNQLQTALRELRQSIADSTQQSGAFKRPNEFQRIDLPRLGDNTPALPSVKKNAFGWKLALGAFLICAGGVLTYSMMLIDTPQEFKGPSQKLPVTLSFQSASGISIAERAKQLEDDARHGKPLPDGLLLAHQGPVTKSDIEALAFIPFERITIRDTAVPIDSLRVLTKNGKIKEFECSRIGLEDEDVASLLQGNSDLTKVVLRFESITDEAINDLASHCKKLEWIDVMGCRRVEGNTLEALQQLPNIKVLNLNRTSLNGRNLKDLKGVPITYLDLAANKLNDDDMQTLAKAATDRLDGLQVNHNYSIGRKGFLALAKIPNLTQLHVIGCSLIDPAYDAVFRKLHPHPETTIIHTNENIVDNFERYTIVRNNMSLQ